MQDDGAAPTLPRGTTALRFCPRQVMGDAHYLRQPALPQVSRCGVTPLAGDREAGLLPVLLCSVTTYVLASGGCAAVALARHWKTT